jgi:hypothetical protein
MGMIIKGANIIKLIQDDLLNKAPVMAINRATNTTVARMKDRITGTYNIKRKDITSHVTITRASKDRQESRINIPSKPLGLIYFSARPTKKGVSYAITKGSRFTRLHAFILNVSTSKSLMDNPDAGERSQVFERYGEKVRRPVVLKSGKSVYKNKQRIKVVPGMQIGKLFIGKRGGDMHAFLQSTFNQEVQKELIQASKYLIGKRSA